MIKGKRDRCPHLVMSSFAPAGWLAVTQGPIEMKRIIKCGRRRRWVVEVASLCESVFLLDPNRDSDDEKPKSSPHETVSRERRRVEGGRWTLSLPVNLCPSRSEEGWLR